MSSSSLFPDFENLRKPTFWELETFCDLVFTEKSNITKGALIREISHYKEEDGLEHEFLLAQVDVKRKTYLLRMERSTPHRQRLTILQKLKQTSSSVLPALDTIRISSSFKKLTSGMDRGPVLLVETLTIPSGDFTLMDLCLILCLFPAFSPQYKLRQEQCYWFCHVVLTTVSASTDSPPSKHGPGYSRAGKFGRISVNLSSPARKLFVDAYTIITSVERRDDISTTDISLTPDSARALVLMLSVPSNQAKALAVQAITVIASYSSNHRQMLIKEGSTLQLGRIFFSVPRPLKKKVFSALSVIDDFESFDIPEQRSPTFRREPEPPEGEVVDDSKCYDETLDYLLYELEGLPPSPRASAKIMVKLAKHIRIRPAISNVLPDIASLTRSVNVDVWRSSAEVIVSLTRYSEFHSRSMPFKMSSYFERVMREIAKHNELHSLINDSIPRLIPLLKEKELDVRASGGKIIKRVMEHVQFRPAIVSSFPLIASLLQDDSWAVQKETVQLIAGLAAYSELRGAIQHDMPLVLKLIKSKQPEVIMATRKALVRIAEYEELRPSLIEVFSHIIPLFKNTSWGVRIHATDLVRDLSFHEDLHSAIPATIPHIVKLLCDNQAEVRVSGTKVIEDLAGYPSLCLVIVNSFPQIAALFDHDSFEIRVIAVDLIVHLSDHSKLRPVIHIAIPRLLKLLNADNNAVRISTRKAISRLAGYPKLHPSIAEALPRVDWSDACKDVAELMSELVAHDALCRAIQGVLPQILTALGDVSPALRKCAVEVVKALVQRSRLRAALKQALPHLSVLPNDSSHNTCGELFELLRKHAEFDEAFMTSLPCFRKVVLFTNSLE